MQMLVCWLLWLQVNILFTLASILFMPLFDVSRVEGVSNFA